MPLLREEAEKLSNNELEQGVIETIIDRDDLFAILPFMKINSKAYLYNREKTLSEATFIDVNDTILKVQQPSKNALRNCVFWLVT